MKIGSVRIADLITEIDEIGGCLLENKSEEFDTYHQADFQATHLQGIRYEWSLPHINWRETILLPKRSYELAMITNG